MMLDLFFAFVLGAVVGSFLNVCIHRIPRGQSLVRPGSACPRCGASIAPWDNVPLLSYILLRGKCRHCGEPISPRYPLVELTTGLLFLTAYLSHGSTLQAVRIAALGCVLIVSIFIDLDHQIIPDVVTLPALGLGVFTGFLGGLGPGLQSILGAAAGGVAVLLIALFGSALFGQESMGGGDLKLAAVIGSYTGWASVLGVLFLSFFLALPVVVVGMLGRRITPASKIPFGPFIAIATFVILFWGQDLWNWYWTAAG